MAWNSMVPIGNLSVKNNRPKLQENITYIEVTMGNSPVGTNTNTTRDHFWNVGSNEDGRHRFLNFPKFTVGGVASDPVIGIGMDGVIYLREIAGRIQGFYKNNSGGVNSGIYQFIPAYIIGTVFINGSGSGDWVTLDSIPANVIGEVVMFKDSDFSICQAGTFSTSASLVRAYSNRTKHGGTTDDYFIELRNDGANALNLQAKLGNAGSGFNGIWHFRITFKGF